MMRFRRALQAPRVISTVFPCLLCDPCGDKSLFRTSLRLWSSLAILGEPSNTSLLVTNRYGHSQARISPRYSRRPDPEVFGLGTTSRLFHHELHPPRKR